MSIKAGSETGYIYTGHTASAASYDDIYTIPCKIDVKQHSYISFDDSGRYSYISFNLSDRSNYLIDDALSPQEQNCKRNVSSKIKNYVVRLFCALIMVTTMTLAFKSYNSIGITNTKPSVIPEKIPYKYEEWFVPVEKWGAKLNFSNCSAFKKVTNVLVFQIAIECYTCNDTEGCTDYLRAYERIVEALNHGEWEYEFFFGDDVQVFEGRGWNCPYSPGKLRLGYLSNCCDPTDLGPSWEHIKNKIIGYGISRDLIEKDVCYDVNPCTKC